MKNQAFIATLLLYPAEEVQAMLSAKEGRTLPADLSHLAKFLIGQGGQKKRIFSAAPAFPEIICIRSFAE